VELLRENHIDLARVSLTGSLAVGLGTEESDFDIVIQADPVTVHRLRSAITVAILDGRLSMPEGSATWMELASTGKSADALVKEGRFAETFTVPGTKPARCSIIYVRDLCEEVCFRLPPEVQGVRSVEGGVQDASEANYKRARYSVVRWDDGSVLQVECRHKWAGLLRAGDRVRVTGVICGADQPLMLQMNPRRHGIERLDRM
ncbi:MAG: nucleotidyltransferase domain-containing protein, partial [Pseudomonadota bacterium]